MKVQLFTPELIEHTDGRMFPAEMVRPNDATEDEYLFVEYEAYQELVKAYDAALKRIMALERALADQQMLQLAVERMAMS